MPIYFGLLTGLLAAPTGDRSQRVGRNEPRWDRDHSGQVGNAAWIARKWDLPPLEHVRFVDRRARRADRADRHLKDRGVVPSQRSALLVRLSHARAIDSTRSHCDGPSSGAWQQHEVAAVRRPEWRSKNQPSMSAQANEHGRKDATAASTASPGADVAGVSPVSGSGVRSPGADVGGVSHSVPAQMWPG